MVGLTRWLAPLLFGLGLVPSVQAQVNDSLLLQSPPRIVLESEAVVVIQLKPGRPGDTCGLSIDWGDGKDETLRVDQNNLRIEKRYRYRSPGTYTVTVGGAYVRRGLNSAIACSGPQNKVALTVLDPIAARAEAERQQADTRVQRADEEVRQRKDELARREVELKEREIAQRERELRLREEELRERERREQQARREEEARRQREEQARKEEQARREAQAKKEEEAKKGSQPPRPTDPKPSKPDGF